MDLEQLAAKLRSLTAPFTTGQLATLAVTFVLVSRLTPPTPNRNLAIFFDDEGEVSRS